MNTNPAQNQDKCRVVQFRTKSNVTNHFHDEGIDNYIRHTNHKLDVGIVITGFLVVGFVVCCVAIAFLISSYLP